MKRKKSMWRRALPIVMVLICIPLVMTFLSDFLGTRADAEQLTITENAIRRAAVQCYALEGFYPPSLDYLVERYGVTVQGAGYFVDYQFVASNLMPDITVLPLSD